MPENKQRKYRQIIDYIEDQVGADINRDLLKVAIDGVDVDNVATNIEEIGGSTQSAVDVANKIDQIEDALQSVAGDEIRSRILAEDAAGNLSQVQAENIGSPLAGSETAIITRQTQALQAIANDEVRSRLFAPDSGGTLQQATIEALNTGVGGGDFGVLTYLARALRTENIDQLNTVTLGLDDTGTLQEVGVEALNVDGNPGVFGLITYGDRALQTHADDEIRSRLLAEDDTGNLAQVQAEELGTAPGGTETALITYLSQALAAIGNDELRVNLENDNLTSNLDTDLQQVGGTAQSGVDIANIIDQLEDALKSIDSDQLVVTKAERDEHIRTESNFELDTGTTGGATLTEQFNVTAGMDTVTVAVDDAEGAYHVEVAFQDGNGNDLVVRDDNNSSSFSGDSTTDVFVDVELAAPQVEVRVVDDSGASNTVDVNIRAN